MNRGVHDALIETDVLHDVDFAVVRPSASGVVEPSVQIAGHDPRPLGSCARTSMRP